jgi:hypothetical protein
MPSFLSMRMGLFTTGVISRPQGGGLIPPYPAPAGYYWNYLTENGTVLTENGQSLVTLEKAA